MLLKKQWVIEEIKEEIKKYLKTNENGNATFSKSMGHIKSSSNREVQTDADLPQGKRKNLK